jgi:hypothetical protein
VWNTTGVLKPQFQSDGHYSLEMAQQLANHADSRTTKLYDRRATKLELEEVTRIRF